MKAVVIHATGGPEQLVLADLPDPVPGAGEVLIDVAYAGCNWADTQVRMGIYPHPMTYPMILGFEVSGTVAALGPGVTGVEVGDRVATFPEKGGAYAEKCLASARGLIKLPDAVGLDVGAAFPIQALTAWHMMWTIYGGIGPGDTVLVNAIGGGVGLMCTQLAVHAGARVIGTTGTPGKEAKALAYGASRVVVTSQEDFERAVLDFTGGRTALQEHPRAHPATLPDLHPPASRPYRPDVGRMAGGCRPGDGRSRRRLAQDAHRGRVCAGRGGGHAPPPRRPGRFRQAPAEGRRLNRRQRSSQTSSKRQLL
jgi:D-arabinose 1-dehydrogenase-like Zn-dependent alcohol dehydrogenase